MKLPYEDWECFQAGLYRANYDEWTSGIEQSAELLRSDWLYEAMKHVSENWSHSANHYFTKNAGAWVPWLGHAACCFEFGVPNWVVKKAWHVLTMDEQCRANAVAHQVYNEWKMESEVYNGQGVLI